MASAWELKGSRDGTSSGGGAFAYPRVFRVRTDSPIDDARITLQLVNNGVPYHSAHPWDFTALAQTYTMIKQWAPRLFDVRVDYKLPELLTPAVSEDMPADWEIELIGSSISVPLLQEIFNGEAPNNPGAIRRLLGVPRYRDPFEGETADEYYAVRTGINASILVPLIREVARTPFQEMRELPTVGLIASKTSTEFRFSNTLEMAAMYKKTNQSEFLGAEPGHVIFNDWRIKADRLQTSRIGGRIRSGIVPTVVYDVQLQFLYSFVPLNVRTQVHTFEDSSGAFSPIYYSSGGAEVEETFGVKESAELNDLFRMF